MSEKTLNSSNLRRKKFPRGQERPYITKDKFLLRLGASWLRTNEFSRNVSSPRPASWGGEARRGGRGGDIPPGAPCLCVRVCPCVGRAGPIRFASVSISQEHAGQQGGPRASTGAGGHSRRPGPSPLLSLPSGRSTSSPRSSLSPQEKKRLLGRFPLAPDLPPTRHCPAKRHTWFRHHRVTGLKGPPLGVNPSAGKRQENSARGHRMGSGSPTLRSSRLRGKSWLPPKAPAESSRPSLGSRPALSRQAWARAHRGGSPPARWTRKGRLCAPRRGMLAANLSGLHHWGLSISAAIYATRGAHIPPLTPLPNE